MAGRTNNSDFSEHYFWNTIYCKFAMEGGAEGVGTGEYDGEDMENFLYFSTNFCSD